MNLPRVDLYFSYWMFFWFILYYYKLTTFNPKWFLVLGVIVNIIIISLMIWYKNSWFVIMFFIVANSLMKLLPLWLIWNRETHWEDIAFGLILGMIYISYFSLIMGSFKKQIMKMIRNIQNNKPVSPILFWWKGNSGF
jgi:hypothetical protein